MCGIVAILACSRGRDVPLILSTSIHHLMNRGYDSIGYRIITDSGDVFTDKAIYPDCYREVNKSLKNITKTSRLWNAVAHTRWATHGCVSIKNTHPIMDNIRKTSAIVHNGIIENESVMRKTLENMGITFTTDTDTEVIIQWMMYLLEETTHDHVDITSQWQIVIQNVLSMIEGTFGLVIQTTDLPDCLFCARRGSPLLIGWSDDKRLFMVVSEKSGFSSEIRSYYRVNDQEVIVIRHNPVSDCFDIYGADVHYHNTESICFMDMDTIDDGPRTLREIMDQPQCILRATNFGGRLRDDHIVLGGLSPLHLSNTRFVYMFGCGTSYHAASLAVSFFQSACPSLDLVLAFDASSFHVGDMYRDTGSDHESLCIFITQSGETYDLFRVINEIRSERPRMTLLGVVNVVDSLIAKTVDAGVYMNCGPEYGVASTKSFTSSLVVLYLIAHYLARGGGVRYSSFQILSDRLASSANYYHVNARLCASKIFDCPNAFIVGKNNDYWIAKEAALKIKELSYIHAEAFDASSLKHGPLALLSEKTPVFFVQTDRRSETYHNIREISARGAPVYLITSLKSSLSVVDNITIIDVFETEDGFPNLFAILFFQFLSFELAVQKNIDPDFPRNLAKVVTVS